MQVTGIIAEYNPFHNGHKYQIAEVRKSKPGAHIVAVISGSFTQRGEAAVLDKWQRARLAVAGGADLVLELPLVFAVRSAQDFARGGVTLLDRLGIVDTLSFGAEERAIAKLTKIASAIDSPAMQASLHEKITAGLSYATALTEAVTLVANDTSTSTTSTSTDYSALLHQPNNILAIEYLRSLNALGSRIAPLLIPRAGAGYHDSDIAAPNASATAVRCLLASARERATSVTSTSRASLPSATISELLTADERALLAAALPPATLDVLSELDPSVLPQMERLFLPLQMLLLRSRYDKLQSIYGINEGLENRIVDCAGSARSYAELIAAATTKRYSASRISRTLLYILLGIATTDIAELDACGPLYARVLAVGPRGRELLPLIKKRATIPLITKTSAYLTTKKRGEKNLTSLEKMLRYDTLGTDLRALCTPLAASSSRQNTMPPANANRKGNISALPNDFQQSPLFL